MESKITRYTVEPGRHIHRDGAPFIALTRVGNTSPTEADSLTHTVCAWLNEADTLTYYTLIVPFATDNPSRWHPTEASGPFATLSRGMFRTERAAHAWAAEHLNGHPYSVRYVDGRAVGEE